MTSLTINTPASNMNTVMSINSASSFDKKASRNTSFYNYVAAPKNVAKKASARIFQIDWDLNMNELEFE